MVYSTFPKSQLQFGSLVSFLILILLLAKSSVIKLYELIVYSTPSLFILVIE